MKMNKQIVLATLAICALAWPALASTQNPVERPFRADATVTWTVNLLDSSAVGLETGVATHGGRYVNQSSVVWDLVNFVIVSGSGVATTADGQQLFWKMTPDPLGVVQITGGTGRFEGATGSFGTTSMSEPIITVDWSTMTMTMTVSYTAAGTITY